jgi:hypothetical protein
MKYMCFECGFWTPSIGAWLYSKASHLTACLVDGIQGAHQVRLDKLLHHFLIFRGGINWRWGNPCQKDMKINLLTG